MYFLLLFRRHPPRIRFRLWPLHNEIIFGEHESEIYPLYSQSAHHGSQVSLALIRYLLIGTSDPSTDEPLHEGYPIPYVRLIILCS